MPLETRYVRMIASGMVVITPRYQNTPADSLTFVMLDCPVRRASEFDKKQYIPAHAAFVAFDANNHDPSGRQIDVPKNQYGYAACLLSKERLSIAQDPQTKVQFDASVATYVADMRTICPDGVMDQSYASATPPTVVPVGGQFFLQSGKVSAEYLDPDAISKVRFAPFCTGIPIEQEITNTVYVELPVQVDSYDPRISIRSVALDGGPPAVELKLKFSGAVLDVWVGSTPIFALQGIPKQKKPSIPPKVEVDFELYYDLSPNVGKGISRSIPQYLQGSGPLPGTERCPPLQNS